MRAVVITQDDPFYLPNAIPSLFSMIDGKHNIVGCVLLPASPFGKRESFIQKALETRRVFGNLFFLHYSVKFIYYKIFHPNKMERIFRSQGIPVIRLTRSINSKDSLEQIESFRSDILISIAGNEIYKSHLIDLTPKGCLNLHTALLPKYRGLMPTFWVLRFQEKQTGVSVFLVDEGIDSGPIVVKKTIKISGKSQEQLIRLTKRIGMECIAEALDIMEMDNPVLIENPSSDATYFGFPTAEDVKAFRMVGARFF